MRPIWKGYRTPLAGAPESADRYLSLEGAERLCTVSSGVPTTRERYDDMIKTIVGDELRALGFKWRRNAFFRKTAQGWSLIDFQASRVSAASSDDLIAPPGLI